MTDQSGWQTAWMLIGSTTVFAFGALAAVGLHHRRTSVGAPFAALSAAAAVWTLAVLMTGLSTPGPQAETWLRVRYAIAMLSPPAVTWFLLEAQGLMPARRLAALAGLCALPLVAIASLCIEPRGGGGWVVHEVAFARTGSVTHLASLVPGPGWWLALGWGYALTIANVGLAIAWARRAGPIVRGQALAAVVGIGAPMLANLSFHLRWVPAWLDPMPLGLAVTAAAAGYAILRLRMLDLVPIARRRVVDAMGDGMLATDTRGRVVDLNPAMCAILGVQPADAIGRPAAALIARTGDLASRLRDAAADTGPDGLFATIRGRHYGARIVPLPLEWPGAEGRLLMLHDLTARVVMERERERLIDELRAALAQIRTLRGLLPLCASCKNVRDAAGRWMPVDAYIRDHSAATVSHGICPDCSAQRYPSAYREPEQDT
jgi:PAS domain S-box-containing protein